MSDCLFCRIADGTIGSKKVYEDEQYLAFDDVNPQAPVHVLVIPKQHIPSLKDLPEHDVECSGMLLKICRIVAEVKGISESGYRVVTNVGEAAGQTVFHVHFHVLGARHLRWPPG